MQWEVFLMGVRFLVDALRRVCDIIIESVDANLTDSFDDEEKLSEGETEVFADVAGVSLGESKSEDVVSPDLHREPEPVSTDFVNAHMSSLGKYYAVRSGYRPGVYLSWSNYRVQVEGFSRAEHKRFKTYHEAEQYVAVDASKMYSRASHSSSR